MNQFAPFHIFLISKSECSVEGISIFKKVEWILVQLSAIKVARN